MGYLFGGDTVTNIRVYFVYLHLVSPVCNCPCSVFYTLMRQKPTVSRFTRVFTVPENTLKYKSLVNLQFLVILFRVTG